LATTTTKTTPAPAIAIARTQRSIDPGTRRRPGFVALANCSRAAAEMAPIDEDACGAAAIDSDSDGEIQHPILNAA